jgi:hypothetical protein
MENNYRCMLRYIEVCFRRNVSCFPSFVQNCLCKLSKKIGICGKDDIGAGEEENNKLLDGPHHAY